MFHKFYPKIAMKHIIIKEDVVSQDAEHVELFYLSQYFKRHSIIRGTCHVHGLYYQFSSNYHFYIRGHF